MFHKYKTSSTIPLEMLLAYVALNILSSQLIEQWLHLHSIIIIIEEKSSVKVTKPEVVTQLEDEANVEAKPTFRFTPTQVQLITYMMDKHGMDFKAMARDPKNHYQETPAKLKGMVTKFISIPEHYAPYCKERGLITPSEKKPEPSLDEVESPTSCDVEEGVEEEVMEDEDNEDADLAPDSSGSESDGENED